MDTLNPTIWSNLPHDILFEIIRQSDHRAKISWSCTSHEFCHFASAQIWHRLRISRRHITAYKDFALLKKTTSRIGLLIHFLLNNAYRPNRRLFYGLRDLRPQPYLYRFGLSEMKQPLPVSRVRHLDIENRAEKMEFWGPDAKHVLPPLLRCCLQNLIALSYDGPLHPALLVIVLKIENLKSLKLRVGAEHIEYPDMASLREPFRVKALDFSLLGTLKKLRTLQIGHLLPNEAEGLAHSVAFLELTHLRLSAHGWTCKVGARTLSPTTPTGGQLAKSPLVWFLEALTKAPKVDFQRSTSFPFTLKELSLEDRYHRVFPFLHRLLAKAILPERFLQYIEIRLLIDLDMQKIHVDLDLPQDKIIIILQSWKQLSSSDKVNINYKYRMSSDYSAGPGARQQTRWTSPLPDADHQAVTNIAEVLDLAIEDPGTKGDCLRVMRIWKEDVVSKDFPEGVVCIDRGYGTRWEKYDPDYSELAGAMSALKLA